MSAHEQKYRALIEKYSNLAMFEDVGLESFDQQGRFDEDTPFHVAAYSGEIEDLKQMLAFGVDINVVGGIGNTALHYAAMADNRPLYEFLIINGALIKKNDYGDLPCDLFDVSD
ncbi:ankyrin repeat domain-containing protein [Motilimonas sp. E26]|uniref:ankyrin repeat domain-containing protein n=1 Tax=Motilimonas TaxID=1914248 RepID=UPI001E534668|nr:ankyrin repeat domain-containing protein [Motilimonas sp. E26]MCE0558393.1 ankyrin repeat domain-containing protein [Motilimonas sp. E26]